MCQYHTGSRDGAAAIVGMNILMLAILDAVPTSLLAVPDLVTGQCRMGIPQGAVALLDRVWLAVGKRKSWRLVCKVHKRSLVALPLGIVDDVVSVGNSFDQGIDILSLPVGTLDKCPVHMTSKRNEVAQRLLDRRFLV